MIVLLLAVWVFASMGAEECPGGRMGLLNPQCGPGVPAPAWSLVNAPAWVAQ